MLRTMQVGLCTLVMRMGGCVILSTMQVGLGTPVVEIGGCIILSTMQVGLGTPVVDMGGCINAQDNTGRSRYIGHGRGRLHQCSGQCRCELTLDMGPKTNNNNNNKNAFRGSGETEAFQKHRG